MTAPVSASRGEEGTRNMGDGSGTADKGKMVSSGLGNGSFHGTPFYTVLCQENHWSMPFALAIAGASVLLAAFLMRTAIYLIIRTTGQYQYTQIWQGIETFIVIAMFVAGGGLGYFVFGNPLSAGLCGVCFGFLSLGVALQALTANEKATR